MKTLTGTLYRPYNNDPLPYAEITFRAVKNGDGVPMGSDSVAKTDESGQYSFSVRDGTYDVTLRQGTSISFIGRNVSISGGEPQTLLEAIQTSDNVTPDVLAAFRSLRGQTQAARDETLAARTEALGYRDETKAYRDDAAAVVTGGTASVDPEPGKIPLAGADGTISPWVADPLRRSVEANSGGRMTVLYDSAGNENYCHILPRFRYEDLGFATEMGTGVCTAFLVDGVEKSEIFIGAYQASEIAGKAVSQPARQPWTSINYDEGIAACAAKGAGWHLMTAHEWAAVAFWCMANGFQPRGNTDYLRAHDAPWEVGRNSGYNDLILSGSGPASWSHTGDYSGIADLVGNVWEWSDGLKLVEGEVFTTPDNDYSLADANWPSAGKFLRNDLGGSPTLAESGSANESYNNVNWADTPTDAGYAPSELLRRLLVEPAGIAPQGRLYARDFGERFPFRGGYRSDGGNAGLAALYLYNDRGDRGSPIGFRPAFVA